MTSDISDHVTRRLLGRLQERTKAKSVHVPSDCSRPFPIDIVGSARKMMPKAAHRAIRTVGAKEQRILLRVESTPDTRVAHVVQSVGKDNYQNCFRRIHLWLRLHFAPFGRLRLSGDLLAVRQLKVDEKTPNDLLQ